MGTGTDTGLLRIERLVMEVQEDIRHVADFWERRKQLMLDPGNTMFMSFVDPAIRYGETPSLEQREINMIFTEWLLFEFEFFEGLTPLEQYLFDPPEDVWASSLARLGQVAETQFFSRFAIGDKNRQTSSLALTDVCTGKTYDVVDRCACEVDNWSYGTLSERIACIDGVWAHVGQMRFYDRAQADLAAEDGPGFFHPEDRLVKPEAEHASFYLRLVRDLIGIDGRYRISTQLRQGA